MNPSCGSMGCGQWLPGLEVIFCILGPSEHTSHCIETDAPIFFSGWKTPSIQPLTGIANVCGLKTCPRSTAGRLSVPEGTCFRWMSW